MLSLRVAEELSNPFRNETITVALCQQTESEIIATTPALTVIAAALSPSDLATFGLNASLCK